MEMGLSFRRIWFLISCAGLDPARPLIEQVASRDYRLTRDDAQVVQIMHTNSGTLGQISLTGSLDLCINGGQVQPFCRRGFRLSMRAIQHLQKRGRDIHILRFFFLIPTDRNRCSHFLAVCYLANAIFKHKLFPFRPCPSGCIGNNGPIIGKSRYSYKASFSSLINLMHIGQDVPDGWVASIFPNPCVDQDSWIIKIDLYVSRHFILGQLEPSACK